MRDENETLRIIIVQVGKRYGCRTERRKGNGQDRGCDIAHGEYLGWRVREERRELCLAVPKSHEAPCEQCEPPWERGYIVLAPAPMRALG